MCCNGVSWQRAPMLRARSFREMHAFRPGFVVRIAVFVWACAAVPCLAQESPASIPAQGSGSQEPEIQRPAPQREPPPDVPEEAPEEDPVPTIFPHLESDRI